MDRFDEIWKNRFNEGDAPLDDNWANPDDLVWEGIDSHLKKDSKRKGWIWFLWGSGLMVLMLAVFMFAFKDDKKRKATPISDKEKSEVTDTLIEKDNNSSLELAASSEKNTNQKEDLTLSENPLFTKKINQKPEAFSQSNFIASNSSERSFSFKNPITKTTSQNPIFENSSFLVGGNELKSQSFLPKENLNIIESDEEKMGAFSNLPSLKAFLLTNFDSNFELPNVESSIRPIEKANRFFVSLNAGAVYWQHRISDQYTEDLSPFDFNYSNNFGWQTSLNTGLVIGKYFEVNAGVRLEKIRVNSGHNTPINYNQADELNSRQTNDYSLTLATPYGLSPADFVLNRSADIAGGSADLTVDFNSGHNITNIQIPAGIRFYPFGKRQRLTAFVETGASFNFLTKVTNEIESIETHHSAIQFTDNGKAFSEPEITKEFYDLRFGGGLSYRFSNSTKFNFSYDYSRGLNPVFEQGNYKTVIDRQHFSLGMMKTF